MASNALDVSLLLNAQARGVTEVTNDVSTLVNQFHAATQAIGSVSNASQLSQDALQQMATLGQQSVQRLENELQAATLQLNHLRATNATPADIDTAVNRVNALRQGLDQTRTAVNAYQQAADAASRTPPVPSQFQQNVAALVSELESTRRGLDSMGNSTTHTREQLQQMGQAATTALNNMQSELEQARLDVNRLAATNATPADIQRAQQRVQELENGVRQVETSLQAYQRQARLANNEVAEGANKAGGSVDKLKGGFNALNGVLASLGVGFSLDALIDIADAFKNVSSQIRLSVGEGNAFYSAMAGVQAVALATKTSLEATGNLFARINDASKDLGLTQQEVLGITQTINQTLKISGSGVQAANAAIVQLIQGLQSGVLRGEEFNSMAEQSPRFMKAMAASLGVTRGELRAMAQDGQLTSEVVIRSIQEQSEVIAAEYAKMPTTIGGALQNLKTNFMVLVGEMDSANASSQSLVKVLLSIADNLDVLKTLVTDASNGISEFTDRLGLIDGSTIDALKDAIGAAYEAVKEVISSFAELGSIAIEALNTTVNALGGVSPEAVAAGEGVSFLTRIFQGLSIVIGFFKDGVAATKIAMNLLIGVFYDVGAAFADIKAKLTFGDLSARFENEAALMRQAAKKAYDEANQQAMDFESEGIKRAREAVKTEEEKNQDKLSSNKQTLLTMAVDEQKALLEQQANNEKRKQLDAELGEARKANNQQAINTILGQLADLDKSDDEFAKANQQRQTEKLKAATQYAQAAIDGNNGILSGERQRELIAQGFIATQEKIGEVTLKAFGQASEASENYGLTASQAAKNAAKALGVDLDEALNTVSRGFTEATKKVDDVAKGFAELKVSGVDATTLIYQSWLKVLETAKNQAEIDIAKQKLVEFGEQGKLSTQQVEAGMQAIRQVVQKLPADLDPVEQAFERLGIKTKEQLALAAQSAMADFNTVSASGKATAADIEKAYQRVIQAAIASGDQSVISQAKAQAAMGGLTVEIDKTGKAVTQTFEEFAFGADKAVKATDRVSSGFDRAGSSGVRAAQSVQEAWDNTVTSISKAAAKLDEITRKQGGMTGSDFLNGGGGNLNKSLNDAGLMSYSEDQIKQKLISEKGYDAQRAAREAKKIFSDQSWARGGVSIANGQLGMSQSGDLTNYNYINSLFDRMDSTISSTMSTMSNNQPEKTVNVNLQLDGRTVNATVPASQEQGFLDMLKQAKRVY